MRLSCIRLVLFEDVGHGGRRAEVLGSKLPEKGVMHAFTDTVVNNFQDCSAPRIKVSALDRGAY